MLNNKGMTMIEMLFVLVIVIILSSISMTFHRPTKQDKVIIKDISSFLNRAKLEAMVSKQTVNVSVGQDIIYSNNEDEKIFTLEEGTYFENHQMSFNNYGHIHKAKTLVYHCHQKTYRFVYQIGSGAFYVE